jgi:hypothetical protein
MNLEKKPQKVLKRRGILPFLATKYMTKVIGR